jgi:hypothetical protein
MAAGIKVAEIWGTKVLTLDERCIGFMINVEVPGADLALCY